MFYEYKEADKEQTCRALFNQNLVTFFFIQPFYAKDFWPNTLDTAANPMMTMKVSFYSTFAAFTHRSVRSNALTVLKTFSGGTCCENMSGFTQTLGPTAASSVGRRSLPGIRWLFIEDYIQVGSNNHQNRIS